MHYRSGDTYFYLFSCLLVELYVCVILLGLLVNVEFRSKKRTGNSFGHSDQSHLCTNNFGWQLSICAIYIRFPSHVSHGNPITGRVATPPTSKRGYFILSVCLYIKFVFILSFHVHSIEYLQSLFLCISLYFSVSLS